MKRYFSLSATALAVMLAAPAALAISATAVPLVSTAQLKTAQTEARWAVELPYPVVKVLAAPDGTAIALTYDHEDNRLGIYGISKDGVIENNGTFIDLKGEKYLFDKVGAQPLLHSDGNLYIPVNIGSPSVATMYQINPSNGYEAKIIFQQGHTDSNKQQNKLLSYQFDQHNHLYVGTGETDADGKVFSKGMFYAVDLANADPQAWLWKKAINSPVDRFVVSPDGEKIALTHSKIGHDLLILNAKGEVLANQFSFLLPDSPSLAMDQHGAVYGANLGSANLTKTTFFDNNANVLWEALTGQQMAEIRNRWVNLGVNNDVFMTFYNHVYAINRDSGKLLFSVAAPDDSLIATPGNGNRFLGYGGVVTDPATGWGYLSYVQKTPVAQVGVLGFSPDGEHQQRLMTFEGDFTTKHELIAVDRDIEMSEPVIFRDTLYVSIDNKVYAWPLNAEASESPLNVSGLKSRYGLNTEGKFDFTFDVTTEETAIVTARLHCHGVPQEVCSGPNVITTVLAPAGEMTPITLRYGHGLQAKPGKYVLSLTARTQAGDETKREFPVEIDDYRY